MLQEFYPTNKTPHFCNSTLLCVTFHGMPDALTIFLYNRPFLTLRITRKLPEVTFQTIQKKILVNWLKWQNSLQYC